MDMQMPLKVVFEKQTSNGKQVKKEGVWIANNGHAVKVITLQNITGRCTWSSREAAYANVSYACDCGRVKTYQGSAKKAHLDTHDAWFTPEQIAHFNALLQDTLRPTVA